MNGNVKLKIAGFGMIELMVAMALGLFLMGAIIQVFVSSKQSFNAVAVASRLQENGNIGLNILTDDLRRAGYMGGNSEIDGITGTTGQYPVPPLPVDTTCQTGNTTWLRMVRQGIFGLNDTNAGYACVPNADYLRGDVLVVRYLSPWQVTAFVSPTLYLRSSWYEGKIFTGLNQANAANTVFDQPQAVREIIAHAYYVRDTGRTCNGQAIPALYSISPDANGQPVAQELIAGVEDFQVRYGVYDKAADSVQYLDADSIALADWNDVGEATATKKVVSVQVWLLARSECTELGFVDPNTYTMGDQVFTPADGFHRQLFTTVVTLRNN